MIAQLFVSAEQHFFYLQGEQESVKILNPWQTSEENIFARSVCSPHGACFRKC